MGGNFKLAVFVNFRNQPIVATFETSRIQLLIFESYDKEVDDKIRAPITAGSVIMNDVISK